MTSLNKVKKYCSEQELLDTNDSVLVGLSGGADSVCLLFMLLKLREELNLKISAIHVHHGIRGEEADRDASFCEELCRKHGVFLKTVRADIPKIAKEMGLGLEEAGRKVRYLEFEKAADEQSCNRIAVAHHMNDRAETVIFQMLRGSKLRGMAGIRPKNGRLIRPLLCLTRNEIEETLREFGQDYVTDSTNMSDDYSRNFIRNRLLPEMAQLREKSCEHIAETADYIGRVEDFLEKQTDALKKECVLINEKDDRIYAEIDIDKISSADPLLMERVIYDVICLVAGRKKDITGEFVDMVKELMKKQSGKQVRLKYGVVARRTYDRVLVTVCDDQNPIDNKLLNCNNDFRRETVRVKKGEALSYIAGHGGFPKDNQRKYFDLDKICVEHGEDCFNAVMARNAQKEDVISLYSDGRGKKVFDVLKDERVESTERDKVSVIAIDNEVLLIRDMRGSEKYRVDENTEKILYLSYLAED